MKNTKYTSSPARRSLPLIASLVVMLMLSACSVYKINVQQGNFMDQEKIDQVAVGMTRNQVRYLLGTPMITDSFHQDRWDYVYRAKYGRSGRVIKRKMSIFFDGDAVQTIEQYGQEPVDKEAQNKADITADSQADAIVEAE